MRQEFFGKLEDKFLYLPSNHFRIVFADLPYGTTKCSWDSLVDLDIFWRECWRVLKDDGVVICTAQVPFNITLGASQLKHLKYEWIWEKTHATGSLNSRKMPMKAHENVMIFYKNLPKYYPIKTKGHERKVSTAKSRAECIKRRNKLNDYLYGKEDADKVSIYDSTERYPRSVLVFPTDKQTNALHPTQKPESLLEYFIQTYSAEGEAILDPCRGSNTTGVVCDKLLREYWGIESSEYYYGLGLLRRKFPEVKGKKLIKLYHETRRNTNRSS